MANRLLLSLIVTTGLFCAGQVRADVADVLPVGDLERWAAFSLGLNGVGDRLLGDAIVQGDFGAAGISRLALTTDSWVQGDIYYRRTGIVRMGQGSGTTGTMQRDQDVLLKQDTDAALNLSRAAGALASTRNYTNIKLEGSDSLNLSGAPGETVVLNLGAFAMTGNSLLTLTGTATTSFVINVNRSFSLASAAQIVLSGVDWNDVIFNVRGRGAQVQISGTATFQGILLATRRTVRLRDSALVRGEVIADALMMQGLARIDHPPVVSP